MNNRVPTVLLISNDQSLSAATMIVLPPGAIAVKAVPDGAATVSALAEASVELSLLDAGPIGDGTAPLTRLRTRLQRIPLLLLTHALEPGLRAHEVDADGYLPRPFGLETLRRRARAHLHI